MKGKKAGFTGTREGITEDQRIRLRIVLFGLSPSEFHHGDCIGADKGSLDVLKGVVQSQYLVYGKDYRPKTVSHPPVSCSLRAFTANDETREPKPYLERNRNIVDETDYLIATLKTMHSERKGGTWYTIRYANKVLKPQMIIWPDGSVLYVGMEMP